MGKPSESKPKPKCHQASGRRRVGAEPPGSAWPLSWQERAAQRRSAGPVEEAANALMFVFFLQIKVNRIFLMLSWGLQCLQSLLPPTPTSTSTPPRTVESIQIWSLSVHLEDSWLEERRQVNRGNTLTVHTHTHPPALLGGASNGWRKVFVHIFPTSSKPSIWQRRPSKYE